MPLRLALADAGEPFGQRIVRGFRYPLRGGAPLTIIAVALFDLLSLFPGAKVIIITLGWGALYAYAFACLRHSADGFADPPEMAMHTEGRSAVTFIVLQLFANALVVLGPLLLGVSGVLVAMLVTFVMPVITMSLAFDDATAALNPRTWIAAIERIGGDYYLLAGVAQACALLQAGANYAMAEHGPVLIGTAIYWLLCNYLAIYTFHLMGALIYRHHQALGYDPEAHDLALEAQPGDDQALLRHVEELARTDVPMATDVLTERLREGVAPAAMHARYRELLRAQGRLPELLVHAQIWISALVAAGETRRALGVMHDALDVDPAFLPDAPNACGPLADTAAHGGMPRLALHLALGYLREWPGDMGAPAYGLLAVRMHDALGQRDAAADLARTLLRTYVDHPVNQDLHHMLDTLEATGRVAR